MKTTITSPHNDLIKSTTKLHNARTRAELRRFLVEGRRACEPFFASRFPLAQLFVTEEQSEWAQNLATDSNKIYLVSGRVMARMSSSTTPSGILAIFDIPDQGDPEELLRPGLVLANLNDPGNMGTLIRTATALGVAIVRIGGVDPFNQKVIQASAGTIAHARLIDMTWEQLTAAAPKRQLVMTALVASGGTDLAALSREQKRLLVVGNEAHGLPIDWLNACQERATIAMPGNAESLNAAVAGSIALYLTYPWER
ncbi:MAG: RNA methyltransferase [Candidatus Dependentiae bacterium]|nr:RNA methyltransferase [Candidatus Dependentiae bacterium]